MANIRFFLDYLTHFVAAKTRHGVHSPFVYRLVDEVIYDFSPKQYDAAIERRRKQLYRYDRAIVKNALPTPRVVQLLARLSAHFEPANMVVIGDCMGIATAYLAKACPASHLYAIEEGQTALLAEETFEQLQLSNINLSVGEPNSTLARLLNDLGTLDLLFINGHHDYEANMCYLSEALNYVNDHSVIIYVDIYWNDDMKKTWETIKAHPKVNLTIDLFYMGLIFLKKGREEEHFKIRF